MSPKTLEPQSIPIPPQLAGRLKQALGRSGTGFDEGAFLQQLHFWTLNANTSGWMLDGVKWVYNSLKSWLTQFPWMSEYGLRKAIANLKKLRLIQTAQHWINAYKRVMFYRIDYEQLAVFIGEVCDLSAHRCVNNDQLDVWTDHTSDPETSSDTSFSEQQTVVVSQELEQVEETHGQGAADQEQTVEGEVDAPGADPISPPSSGKSSKIQPPEFPELVEAVAEAIARPPGSPLPVALKRAICQFPDRVKGAIAYLHHQQQRRTIQNPVGYLYEAIAQGWEVAISETSGVPLGFRQWFDWASGQGWAIASMTIDGVHHTMHPERGWVPTVQMMREYSGKEG